MWYLVWGILFFLSYGFLESNSAHTLPHNCVMWYFIFSYEQLLLFHNYYIDFLITVGSLTAAFIPLDSIISLTWTPHFSINVNPDITYCVDVVNSTSSLVLHSQCNITDTQYNYTVSPRSTCTCDTYTFTVTPVTVVGNGTSASERCNQSSGEYIIKLISNAIY